MNGFRGSNVFCSAFAHVNRSASPSGGNQVDCSPPALRNTLTGVIAEVVAKIVLGLSRCSILKFLQSVNSFGPIVFFIVFSHVAFNWWCQIAK